MIKHIYYILFAMFLSWASPASAIMCHDYHRMSRLMIGGGYNNVLDSYLSPYNYSGSEVRFLYESMSARSRGYNMSPLFDDEDAYEAFERSIWRGVITHQNMIDLHASSLSNHAGNVNGYAVGFRYSHSWLYALKDAGTSVKNLNIYVGPAASGYLGCVYNTRNGNNPTQVKADIMADLVGKANYDFVLFNREFNASYQLNVPLLGCAFSPNYGQSYYEIFSMGHYDHNVVFTNPFNMPSFRQVLSVEIPYRILGGNFRVGYYGEFMQSNFNELKYHSYSNGFLIGWKKTWR